MAIEWSEPQRVAVTEALARHPRSSPRCVDAAREVLPVARERDTSAHALLVEPAMPFGRYVLPKHQPSPSWYHHVLVHTERHGVDAMTGPDGHPYASYLSAYFEAADAHRVSAIDLAGELP